MSITANTRTHASSEQAMDDIGLVMNQFGDMSDWREVDDSTALTIASWYSSPGSVGAVLAELASTGTCDFDDLMDDIAATRQTDGQSVELDLLSTWAINHPSRS